MRRSSLLLLIAALHGWGAARVASVSGNWHNTATWGGAAIPGNGDTVTINDGITVTCEAGQQCIAGASPADNSGVAAVGCTNANSGTAQLVVNGTLTFRGRVDQCRRGTWTVGAGGVLEHDSSLAASPAATHYLWQFGTDWENVYCTLNLNGTPASPVNLRVAAGSGDAFGFTYAQATSFYWRSAKLTAIYTNISHWGSSGYWARLNHDQDPGPVVTLDHVTAVDNVGGLRFENFCLTCGLSITNSYLKAGPGAAGGYVIDMEFSGAVSGTPARLIANSVLAGGIMWFMGQSKNSGFTFRDSILTGIFNNVGGNYGITRNVLFDSKVTGTGPPTASLYGTIDGLYVLQVNTVINPHPYTFRQDPGATTVNRFIYETSFGNDTEGDPIQVELAPSIPSPVAVTRSITLPSGQGGFVGSFFNVSASVGAPSNLQVTGEHNTINLGFNGAVSGFGGEVNPGAAGEFPSIRSNLAWHPGSVAPALLTSYSPVPPDGTFSQVDYNWTYNTTGTIYGLTTAKYTNPAPPGAHDGSGNPQFADPSRRLALFDQKYLGAAPGTEWNSYGSGQSFNTGDIVSHQVAGYFGNVAVNYRCIAAHTKSTANSEPGMGSSWPVYWEYAGLESIRQSILAGQAITDGAIGASGDSMVGALIKWVMRGFTPQNRTLCAAGHDATAPGAVACDPAMAIVQ